MRVLLDLRPPKLIKRPASQVSWVRVLLGLLGGGVLFLALVNLGYGTFRVVQFHREAARLEQERQQLEAQAGKLGSEAERLKKRQADLEGQLAFLQEDLPSLELLSALDVLTPQGVSLAGLQLKGKALTLRGSAENQDQIVAFTTALSKHPLFAKVLLPTTDPPAEGGKATRLSFSLECVLQDWNAYLTKLRSGGP